MVCKVTGASVKGKALKTLVAETLAAAWGQGAAPAGKAKAGPETGADAMSLHELLEKSSEANIQLLGLGAAGVTELEIRRPKRGPIQVCVRTNDAPHSAPVEDLEDAAFARRLEELFAAVVVADEDLQVRVSGAPVRGKALPALVRARLQAKGVRFGDPSAVEIARGLVAGEQNGRLSDSAVNRLATLPRQLPDDLPDDLVPVLFDLFERHLVFDGVRAGHFGALLAAIGRSGWQDAPLATRVVWGFGVGDLGMSHSDIAKLSVSEHATFMRRAAAWARIDALRTPNGRIVKTALDGIHDVAAQDDVVALSCDVLRRCGARATVGHACHITFLGAVATHPAITALEAHVASAKDRLDLQKIEYALSLATAAGVVDLRERVKERLTAL